MDIKIKIWKNSFVKYKWLGYIYDILCIEISIFKAEEIDEICFM